MRNPQAVVRTFVLGPLLATLLFVIGLVPVICASAAEPADVLDAHLQAGEFLPARELATAAPDANARDTMLARIAAAQAASGARVAAAETAFDISSDSLRHQSWSQIAAAREQQMARGGGVQADFDSLIELITSTIAPTTWDEVGGPGSIDGFAGGVFVDTSGLLSKLDAADDRSLAMIRRDSEALVSRERPAGDPRRESVLRKVSLTRLEREVAMRASLGLPIDESMQTLAGIRRVQYLLVYPKTGDIVLAGPAGDWRHDTEARMVSTKTGEPVVMLDDLIVLLRQAMSKEGPFGCSITPRREGLEAAQATNAKWSAAPLKSARDRERWLTDLRTSLGKQDITVYGIDPRTQVARLLVEADYRMKLVGMGLEPGVLGVESYLNSIELKAGEAPPPMSVLRWYFALRHEAVTATVERDAFALRGPSVQVLSENELLTLRGERVHTGKSDELNERFARSFSKHFDALAAKYPAYAQLRNIFDLAVITAVIDSHSLADQVQWEPTAFAADGSYEPELAVAPKEVESVINCRVIHGKHVVAGVSGGVTVDPRTLAKPSSVKTDEYGLIATERRTSEPQQLDRHQWWWD